MLKKGMILSVVAGIALVSWCAFNAANANVCFLPDGDCSTDNTSSLADGDNPWRNGGPDPKPNNDCSGDENKPTPKECYDCDSCVNDAGQTLYKNCHIIKDHEVVDGQCQKVGQCPKGYKPRSKLNCGAHVKIEPHETATDCYKCGDCEDDYKLDASGKCVLAQCPTGYPSEEDKTSLGFICDKHNTLNCWNCNCPKDYSYTSNPDPEKYNCQSHPTAKGCFSCARKIVECTYQYRHANANDVMPRESNGNAVNSPVNDVIASTKGGNPYDVNYFQQLLGLKSIYVSTNGVSIYGIYDKIDKQSEHCTRDGVEYYERICKGSLERNCTSSRKIFEKNCESTGYSFYHNNEALKENYGVCKCNTSRGYYDKQDECTPHITNPDNEYCELADGCYSIANGSPTKATVKYYVGSTVSSYGGYTGGVRINLTCSGSGGLLYVYVVNFVSKIKNGEPDYREMLFLSRDGIMVDPGEYAVCWEVYSNSGATFNGQYLFAEQMIGLQFDDITISENSDLSNSKCYVDRTKQYTEHHGKTCSALEDGAFHTTGSSPKWEIRCFKYNLKAGKTYYVGNWLSTGSFAKCSYSSSPMDGSYLGY